MLKELQNKTNEELIVNYGLNQSYIISKNVFQDLASKIIKRNKNVVLLAKPQIDIVDKSSNVSIVLKLKIIKTSIEIDFYSKLVDNLKKNIKSLIGISPKNITIIF